MRPGKKRPSCCLLIEASRIAYIRTVGSAAVCHKRRKASHDPQNEIHDNSRPRSRSCTSLLLTYRTLGFTLQTDQPMGPRPALVSRVRLPKGGTLAWPVHPSRIGESDRNLHRYLVWKSPRCAEDLQGTHRQGRRVPETAEGRMWGVSAVMKDSEGNQLVLSSSRCAEFLGSQVFPIRA